jgi:hypothetical protein
MAVLTSDLSFDMANVNLNRLHSGVPQLQKNLFIPFNGVVLQDVYDVEFYL